MTEAPSTTPSPVDLIVLTGVSGSGKTTALRALEDGGYFCVDNLPVPLLSRFVDLSDEGDHPKRLAVAIDIRGAAAYPNAREAIENLEAARPLRVLFLDCDDGRVIDRFKETRRRHPLLGAGGAPVLSEAIALERRWLEPLRAMARTVIDTTELNTHQLKHRIQALYAPVEHRGLAIHVMSFGFRHGIPREADFVFDVRFLPNPHYVAELRPLTGLHDPVSRFVLGEPAATRLLAQLHALFGELLPLIDRDGRATLTIAIGCTGGRHRSVAMVEAFGEHLRILGRSPSLGHRDIAR